MPADLADDLDNPNLPDPELLCDAAYIGDLKKCRALLSQGALVNKSNGAARTPLFRAAEGGHIAICQLLVDSGADVRSKSTGGDTVLNYAIRGFGPNASDILPILLRADAKNPGDKTSFYSVYAAFFTPFQYAVKRGATQVVKLLIDEFDEDPGQATVDGVSMVDLTGNLDTKTLLMASIAARSVQAAIGEPTWELDAQANSLGAPQRRPRSPDFGSL